MILKSTLFKKSTGEIICIYATQTHDFLTDDDERIVFTEEYTTI